MGGVSNTVGPRNIHICRQKLAAALCKEWNKYVPLGRALLHLKLANTLEKYPKKKLGGGGMKKSGRKEPCRTWEERTLGMRMDAPCNG